MIPRVNDFVLMKVAIGETVWLRPIRREYFRGRAYIVSDLHGECGRTQSNGNNSQQDFFHSSFSFELRWIQYLRETKYRTLARTGSSWLVPVQMGVVLESDPAG
jgi:hypothetical protein